MEQLDNQSENSNEMENEEKKEADQIWKAFMQFDREHLGYMLTSDLKNALEWLGETCSDDEVYLMIANADPQNTGSIQFSQFKLIIQDRREDKRGSSEEELL